MRIIELFAGIGACSKALENLGIDFEIVDAVEIDKYAIKSFNAVHGTAFEPQDICKWDKYYDNIDLIMHGSPCQDFSLAGKNAGGDKGSGTRSSLMYETLRIVEKIKPKYVVWENVKNILSPKHKHNFDNYLFKMTELGYTNYYKILNAKDYLIPQNRERVFTISILDNKSFNFPEPQELKLKLKDLLEPEVEEKYYLSDKLIAGLIKHTERHEEKGHGFKFQTTEGEGVASSITTRVGACRTGDNYIKQIGELDIKGHDCVKRVYSPEGISPTLTNMQGGNRQPKIIEDNYIINKYNNFIDKRGYMPDMFNPYNDAEIKDVAPTQSTACGCMTSSATVLVKEATAVAQRGRYNPDGKVEQQLELSDREYANALTTVQKDSMACLKIKNATKQGYLEAQNGDGVYISAINKKRGTVQKDKIQTIKTSPDVGVVVGEEKLRIRKLSPRECWRLMRV